MTTTRSLDVISPIPSPAKSAQWPSNLGLLGSLALLTYILYSQGYLGGKKEGTRAAMSIPGPLQLTAESQERFRRKYAHVGAQQLGTVYEDYCADYDTMISDMVNSMFEANICREILLSENGYSYLSALPKPFVFTSVVWRDNVKYLRVIELDQAHFPEVWEAFAEGTWLNAALTHHRLDVPKGEQQLENQVEQK